MTELEGHSSAAKDSAEFASAALLTDIEDAVRDGDRRWLSRVLARLHPADASDVLEQLSSDDFSGVVSLLGEELPSDVLIELRDEYREDAVEVLPDEAVTAAIGDLESDDATAILEDMEDDRRDRILDDLAPEDRAPLQQALDFDEETAGRLMQREFVAAPEFWTVGHTVDHARDQGDDLPDQFFEIYVVDPAFKVLGAVPLATLLKTSRDVALSVIMPVIRPFSSTTGADA
ncbi:MAG: magnesium transporter, partial [Pseudomonadota bacterium]